MSLQCSVFHCLNSALCVVYIPLCIFLNLSAFNSIKIWSYRVPQEILTFIPSSKQDESQERQTSFLFLRLIVEVYFKRQRQIYSWFMLIELPLL